MSPALDNHCIEQVEMIRRVRLEIEQLDSGQNNQDASYRREMLMGLTRNLSTGLNYTSSVAGGYLKVGASAVVSSADVVARNVSATAAMMPQMGPSPEVDQQEITKTEN